MIIADLQDLSPPAPQGLLQVVTQNDHAHFAAELLSLWRGDGFPEHPRRRQILLAAREHDNGWREADSAPRADPETGRPFDLATVPQELRREIWRRGVARSGAEHEPWTAVLVLQHAIHLHRDRRSAAWLELCGEWLELRAELLDAAGADLPTLERDYRWVELADLLSLAFCSAPWQPVVKVLRAPEREIFRQIKAPNCRDTGGISKFGNAELAEKIRSGRGLTFATGCWGVGEDISTWQRAFELHGTRAEVRSPALVLDPFPLAGATTFRIPCRRIPARRYRGDADLGTELAAARWGELTVRVAPLRNGPSAAV